MSRTRKRQSTGYYRQTISGYKRAKLNKLRSIPPNPWEDLRADNQCHTMRGIIEDMFNAGIELEEIENKVKNEYGVPHWQWKDFDSDLDNTIEVQFDDLVALNEDHTALIPITTPNAKPYVTIEVNLPIKNILIITEDKLLRLQKKKWVFSNTTFHDGEYVKMNKIFPFPNKKLTEIFLFLGDHYVENGMINNYVIKKWKMGLDKCRIECEEEE